MERRICLLCSDRPGFDDKVEAYIHLRSAHPLMLDEHHPDEFFEVRGALPSFREEEVGPFFCALCAQGFKYLQRSSAVDHVQRDHEIPRSLIEYGVHFISESEALRREAARKQDELRIGDEFETRVESLRGVADFLTECGELVPPEEPS